MLVQALSSVAQQRRELGALHIRYNECAAVLANAFSPAASYFCFLKECLSAIAKGTRARPSEAEGWRWLGGWEPLSFLRMHFILSLERAAALQGIRGSAEVLLTQLLQFRTTACNQPPGNWAHLEACLVPSSSCPTSSPCITAVTLENI